MNVKNFKRSLFYIQNNIVGRSGMCGWGGGGEGGGYNCVCGDVFRNFPARRLYTIYTSQHSITSSCTVCHVIVL